VTAGATNQPETAPAAASATPPSALNLAGQMVGKVVTGLPGKIAGGVLGVLIVALMIVSGISEGVAGAIGALFVSVFVLFGLLIAFGIPAFVVVLIIAAMRARKLEVGAMQGYAAQRGLGFAPSGALPATTPLLTAGNRRETQDLMTGTLPGGVEGTLAHYTFHVRTQSSQGRSSSVAYPHTVVLTQLPESAIFVKRLTCHSHRRLKTATLFGLDFSSDEEVHLESSVVRERFQIRTSGGQDQAWLRELFTPTFVDWLATQTPEEFSFELVDGLLVVGVGERYNRADYLDWFCGVAAYVRNRIHSEVREDAPPPPVPS
jgi:hypothetical protein